MSNTLDLSIDLEALMSVFAEMPSAIQAAAETGLAIPPGLIKYAPLAGMLTSVAGRVIKTGPKTGLSVKGEPDMGPLGKGRQQYLRLKDNFTDSDVSQAFYHILDAELPSTQKLKSACDYSLSFIAPGESIDGSVKPTDEHLRRSIDSILISNALHDEAQCDKFGDLLNYTLCAMIKKRRA